MFVHNIDPVLLRIAGLEIRYYGVIYAFGFILTLLYLLWLAKRRMINLDEDEVYDLVTYLIVGVLLGARIFEVIFYHPGYYFSNPSQIIAYWNGGLSFHGGLLGAIAALAMFARRKKHNFYEISDALVVPVSLALALGRIANFINGELYGKVTSLPWGVKFQDAQGFRHPTQLYESTKNFMIFAVLFTMRNRKLKRGTLTWAFVAMYGFLRFWIEFLKEPETLWFGMPLGQILSALMFIAGGYVLYNNYSSQ